MEINLLIKAWRGHKHLTFRELSELSGFSLSTLTDWEKGRRPANKKKIRLLAEKLGLTLEEFYAGPDADNDKTAQLKEIVVAGKHLVPDDLISELEKIAQETGIGIDILIRSSVGVFVNLKRPAQLSVLRAYLDVAGNRIEEMINNLDHNSDQDTQ